jgi:hypothetical protein
VTATTVVPGLMRTGSHVRAGFTSQRDEEFSWFALAASLPVISMDAERAARQIIDAMRARRAEIILTPAGQLAARGAGIFPELTTSVLHLAQRLLLPAPDGSGKGAVPGRNLRPAMRKRTFDSLTALGRASARRFNEE